MDDILLLVKGIKLDVACGLMVSPLGILAASGEVSNVQVL